MCASLATAPVALASFLVALAVAAIGGEALMFVVHFVGDMHQPLHTGNREDDRAQARE